MNLSRNFSLQELIKSDTAIRMDIDNNPNADQIEKLKALCENILQPVRDHYGRVKVNLDFDQLILEFYTPGEPNSGWIHCSYTPDQPRKQFLHAFKSEGKTKYKPVIGSARNLV